MGYDLLVLPEETSTGGLVTGTDLLIQDFMLVLLNHGERLPYSPAIPILPITSLVLKSSNVPQLSEVALAFNLSLPDIKDRMRAINSDYADAQLNGLRNSTQPGVIEIEILITTVSGGSVLVQKTLTIGSGNG